MPSDIEAIVGTTAALHLSRHVVKIVVKVTALSGVQHFALDSRPEIKAYIDNRGSARISGPVVGSFVAPASADIVVSATATIVPTDVSSWPTTLEQVAEDSAAVNFAVSALSPVPTAVINLAEVINSQIKPRPQAGRHPDLLFAWHATTTDPTINARFEFKVPIEFSGVDWLKPVSW